MIDAQQGKLAGVGAAGYLVEKTQRIFSADPHGVWETSGGDQHVDHTG